MFGKKKPEEVSALGGRPIDWAGLDGGGYVVTFADALAVTQPEQEVLRHEWSDFENASWSEEKRQITITYVDGAEPLRIQFAPESKQKIAYVIRERLQRSIVLQEAADLPSGAVARGMVRRSGDESLFTQVIIDGVSGPEDNDAVASLERSLRDITGITED
ncbi:hypothetical protein [Ancrocorticia populi]|uniref:hypothetical protein n=3 Tax=Ancrocorticia populi TaxID=2175228 RepID=UPI003F8ED720